MISVAASTEMSVGLPEEHMFSSNLAGINASQSIIEARGSLRHGASQALDSALFLFELKSAVL